MNGTVEDSCLNVEEVKSIVGLARSTIYKWVNEGNFPEPIRLGGRRVAWLRSEIFEYIAARAKERKPTASSGVSV